MAQENPIVTIMWVGVLLFVLGLIFSAVFNASYLLFWGSILLMVVGLCVGIFCAVKLYPDSVKDR